MPSYRFEFVGGISPATVLADLPDDEAARNEALRTLNEIGLEAIPPKQGPRLMAIEIYAEDGRRVDTAVPAAFTGMSVPKRDGASDD